MRCDGEPSGVHEHGERRPVGQVMAKEVLEKQVEGALLGSIVVASVDHRAAKRVVHGYELGTNQQEQIGLSTSRQQQSAKIT